MKTDEANPQDWFLLAAERLSAADVLYAQSGSTYSGIEILQEAVGLSIIRAATYLLLVRITTNFASKQVIW